MVQLITLSTPTRVEVELGSGCGWAVTMMTCGYPLPWVDHCKHLGNYLKNKIDGMKHDLTIKQSMQYTNKNNDLEHTMLNY